MKRYILGILLILITVSLSFSQEIEEIFVSNVSSFIKASTSFLNGFVFSTPKEIYYFDLQTRKIQKITTIEQKVKDAVITTLTSSEKNLFIGTTKGVLIVDSKFSVISEVNQNFGLQDNNITSLYYHNGYLYIGTRFWGVYIFDIENRIIFKTPITVINGIADNFIRDINVSYFDQVIASQEGISILDPISSIYLTYSSKDYPILSGNIFSILADGDNIIIGTSVGLFMLNRITEKLTKLLTSSIFSIKKIGDTLILGTYDGIIFYDLDKNSISTPRNELLKEPLASTISINQDKVFVGFDNKRGTFAILEIKKPFLTIRKIEYVSKNNILVDLQGNRIQSVKNIDVFLTSINLGRTLKPPKETRVQKDKIEILINTTTLSDDIYSLVVDYFYGNEKESLRGILVIKNKPPTISFSSIPLFQNQRKVEITGRLDSLNINEIFALVNNRREIVSLDRVQSRFILSTILTEGTNNISVFLKDSFNNINSNQIMIILDTTLPEITSKENTIVESNRRFSITVKESYLQRIVFSEMISNLQEIKSNDLTTYFFSIPNRNLKNIKVIVYDRAGNSTSRDFDIKFEKEDGDILITAPQKSEKEDIKIDITPQGNFRRLTLYLQGIPIALLENLSKPFSTNIQLQPGRNIIRVEGFLQTGQVINRSITIEYIPKADYQTEITTPHNQGDIYRELSKLKRENEELKRKIQELEDTIRKLSEGKTFERVIVKTDSVENIPSLIRVDYDPTFDNFAKISKRLYGSESFSIYFYYLYENTKITELVSQKGFIIAPNKKLLDLILKTGDITMFSSLSGIVEWWISREIKQPESIQSIAKRLGIKLSNGRIISEGGKSITFSPKEKQILVYIQ